MAHIRELCVAAARGDILFLKRSEHHHPGLKVVDESTGASLLHFGVLGGEDVVRYLIEAGVPIDQKTKDGDTALHLALQTSSAVVAKVLIERGADITAKNAAGKDVARLAQEQKRREDLFKKAGVKPARISAEDLASTPLPFPLEGCLSQLTEQASVSKRQDNVDRDVGANADIDVESEGELSDTGIFESESSLKNALDSIAPGALFEEEASSAAAAGGEDARSGSANSKKCPFPSTSKADRPSHSISLLREGLASRVVAPPPEVPQLRASTAPPLPLSLLTFNGRTQDIKVPEDYTGEELLHAVAAELDLPITDMFELVVRDSSGKVAMVVSPFKTVKEQRLSVRMSLEIHARYFRVPLGDADIVTISALYSQTRDDVLQGRMAVSESVAVQLAGCELQVEHGDVNPQMTHAMMGDAAVLKRYLPEKLVMRSSDCDLWRRRLFFAQTALAGLSHVDAMRRYLDVAKNIPAFGATRFNTKVGTSPVPVAVVQDGVLCMRPDGKGYTFYSVFKRPPGKLTSVLCKWAVRDECVDLTVLKSGATEEEVIALGFTGRKEDAQRFCDLLSGYYVLLVYGNSVAGRPLPILQDVAVPRHVLPLRTVFTPPWDRPQDVGFYSCVDFFIDAYYKTCVDAVAPWSLRLLADATILSDAQEAWRVLNLASGEWGAPSLVALADALDAALKFQCTCKNIEIEEINLSNANLAADPERLSAVQRLLRVIGEGGCSVKRLDLSNNDLSEDVHWEVLGPGIAACKPLNHVDFSHNNLGSTAKVCMATLIDGHHSVIDLNVSHNDLDDAMALQVGKHIFNPKSHYTSLDVSYNNIGDFGLATGFLSVLNKSTFMRTFNFGHNSISKKGTKELVKYIQNKRVLSHLLVGKCHLSDCTPFVSRLNTNTLMELDLSGNSLGKHFKDLIAPIKTSHSLTSLDLTDTGIDKSGINALIDALPSNPKLARLVLADVGMHNDQAVALAANLAAHPLTDLDLSHNSLSSKCLAGVAAGIAHCHVKRLSLAGHKFGHSREVAAGLCEMVADDRCGLERLDISHNNLGKATAEVFKALTSNKTLSDVTVRDNGLSAKDIASIIPILNKNDGVRLVDLRGNHTFKRKEWHVLHTKVKINCSCQVDMEG